MLYRVVAGPVCPPMCDVWWGAYIVPTRSETDYVTPEFSMPDSPTPSQSSDPNRSSNEEITIAPAKKTNTEKRIMLQSNAGTSLVFSVSLKDKYRNKVQDVNLLEGLGIQIALVLSSMSDQITFPEEKFAEQKHSDGVTNGGSQQDYVFTFLENTNGVIPCIFECPIIVGEYHMIVSLGT